MAQTLSVNVYQINDDQMKTPPQRMGFPVSQIVLRPAPAGFKVGSVDIYGIVQLRPSGLNVQSPQHYVVETVAALVTACNA